MRPLSELRARFLAMHDPRKVQQAEDAALLTCALAVYEGAIARRERAQEAVLAALDTEKEWCAIVHGLAVRFAQAVDADHSPACRRSSQDHSTSSPGDDNE